jgi:hypothetical protein
MDQQQRDLREIRRELASARRALQGRWFARGQTIGHETTVQALSAVLQDSLPQAMTELQHDRSRLPEELRQTQAHLRTQKERYTQIRYEVWRLAQAGV